MCIDCASRPILREIYIDDLIESGLFSKGALMLDIAMVEP
jgi:hypothetical protein